MPRPVSKVKDERGFLQGVADGLRHSSRNPDINKYKPHPKQRIFHESSKPGRQFIGGNRSGKTVGGGAETVMLARKVHPYKRIPWEGPLRLRVVTVDLINGLEKIVLPEIKRWVVPSDLINGSWEDSYSRSLRTLTLANGSFIEFMTHEQDLDSYAGTSRHGIWFDEEPPKNIFTECKLRLIDTEGWWWMTMTPIEGMTWTYEEIFENGASELIDVIVVDMDDNPHLSQKGKDIVLAGLDDDEIKKRKHGQYVSVGGLIYSEPKIIAPIRFEDLPRESLHIASMDHGYTNATAWLWAFADTSGNLVVYDEYYKDHEIVEVHAREVIRRSIQHGIPPAYNVGDPSIRNSLPNTGTSVQIEYMDHGIPIVLGNNDVRAGIDRVKKLFRTDKLFITANCQKLIWEMQRYRWATWRISKDQFDKNAKEEPQKKNDHACDALRYLVASRPEAEDGVSLYVPRNFLNAPNAVDPTKGRIDIELTRISTAATSDYNLGDDY